VSEPGVHVPSADEAAEYAKRLEEARIEENKVPVRMLNGKIVAWAPQNGSQVAFMQCSLLECLFHGTRGPGKTDSLLMAFAQHVGKGYGAAWRGIIFRQTYPQLADVQAKSEKWFRQIFPAAKFNRTKMMWEWPTGEVLMFRHMNSPGDYWNYHGHEYPFIGWEELTNWATDECYKSMFSCCRCSTPGVPRMIRATTNPYGVGHNWVKARWRLDGKWWTTLIIADAKDADGRSEPVRCAIHGHIDENKILLEADPHYKQTVVASAANPAMAKAWLHGSWAIVAGGMFGDVWSPAVHLVRAFAIPDSWRLDRSFDWGSSKPFSVGWWAESDGSDYLDANKKWRSSVRGDLFRIHEWYGCTQKANEGLQLLATEIAKGIVERELQWGIHGRVKPGPADSSIFNTENGNCIADDMERRVRLDDGQVYRGVSWIAADKRPGSRKGGWEQMRKAFKDAMPNKDGRPRENPGLFVFDEECPAFKRTVPNLPRDEKDMDDVDTSAEDHVGDEARYKVRTMGIRARSTVHTGVI
jgi:hypothetical protein